MKVEPEVPMFDQPKGWQDVTQGFLRDYSTTSPLCARGIEVTNSSHHLSVDTCEILHVDRK